MASEIEFLKTQLEFLRRDFEALKEEVLLLKKKQTTRKHSFEKSEWYQYEKFTEHLVGKGWHNEQIKYYYQSAENYSKANGAKYADWMQAILNWQARDLKKSNPGQQSKFERIQKSK